jgi:predicted DCC family thiol-disulfide oxidoreductase YuxK
LTVTNPEIVLLFDGECLFCQGSVQFVIRRDPKKRIKFAALQHSAARLAKCGFDPNHRDGVVAIVGERCYHKSDAALQIARRLSWPWPLLVVFGVVPRVVRDWLYDAFAKRRYRWFGKSETCMVPSPEDRERFITEPPP